MAIARKVAENRVISTVDPDARHTRKSPEARRDGYRAHVAADLGTGIITDEKLTGAAGVENSDAAVAAEFVTAEAAAEDARDGGNAGGGQLTWYSDSAYGTGGLRAAIAGARHRAVIEPRWLLSAVKGGFTADDFTVNAAAGTVTCPAGITRRLTAKNAVIFGPACRACPLRQQCTTAKAGRTLHLREHDGLLRAARADWAARPGAARGLQHTPAPRRAGHRPGRHLAGTPPQAPLPRRRQEPRLAQAPHRRSQPAQSPRQGPGPPRWHVDRGDLTSRPGPTLPDWSARTKACQAALRATPGTRQQLPAAGPPPPKKHLHTPRPLARTV